MASPVRVKQEPDDVYNVETDTEHEDVSMDELQLLDSKFASMLKFPVGCKIWYDVLKSAKPKRRLEGKSASVVGVYLHFENMKRVYKVKTDTPTQYEVLLYEDRLVYGMNCPVQVTNPDTNELVDGVIMCPKLEKGDDGKQKISYAVQLLNENKVFIEFGVASEQIRYRLDRSDDKASRVQHPKQTEEAQPRREQERNTDIKETACDSDKAANLDASVTDNPNGTEDGLKDHTKRKGEVSRYSNERPQKQLKTTINVSKNFVTCTCILTIPTWVKQTHPMALFLHLMGVEDGETGCNIERIRTMTDCSVQISNGSPMRVTITCNNSIMPYSAENVTKAVSMIEQSLIDYLSDQNSVKRLLFELSSTATGSYADNRLPREFKSEGLVLKYNDGQKSWWRLFDLPCKWREGSGGDHDRCLWKLKSFGVNATKVQLFGNNFGVPLEHAAPYIIIMGVNLSDVRKTTLKIVNVVKRHQCQCNCRPKW